MENMEQKGQVTIEFILVLVIALTLLTAVSIPLTEFTEDTIMQTSSLTNLAAQQQKIQQATESIALSGCGSKKIIQVKIPVRDQSKYCAGLRINPTNITGHLSTSEDIENLTSMEISPYIEISSEDAYEVKENYEVKIEKTCANEKPTDKFTIGANYSHCSPIV